MNQEFGYHIKYSKEHGDIRIASFRYEYDRDHFFTEFLSDRPDDFEKEDGEVE